MSLSDKLSGVTFKWVRRPEILLCANTVKPLHGVVPRILLGAEWWEVTRKAAYASTLFHCIACGVHKNEAEEHRWLEGHEVYSVDYERGRQTYLETVPLCHYCHNFIHCGRLLALAQKGEITREKYRVVMKHGRRILKEAGLKEPKPYTGKMAEWGRWRLVIDGRKYKPLYKTYAKWLEHFDPQEQG